MNVQGVYLHILGDALGSVAAIVSGLVIWLSDSKYHAIQTTSLGSANPDYDDSDTDDSSVLSSPMDLDDTRFDDTMPYDVWKEQPPRTIDNGLTRPGSRAMGQ